MTPQSRMRFAHLLLFIAPALWSANYIAARLAAGVVEPHLLALMRWSMAFALMLPFALPELRKKWPQWRHEWRDLVVLGALGMWVCGAFVYIGGQTTSATNIGLLYALAPALIAGISAHLFDDRLRGVQIVGVTMAMAGMLTIVAKGNIQHIIDVVFTTGDLWIMVAVSCWTAYSIGLRRQPSVLGPFARLTAITAGGVLVLIPFTAVETWFAGPPDDWSVALWLGVITAVLPGFGAYQAYSFMQRELGPAKTGLVLYLGPLYAAMVAWWILGEVPMWFHGAGALLILPGMYLATRSIPTKSKTSAA